MDHHDDVNDRFKNVDANWQTNPPAESSHGRRSAPSFNSAAVNNISSGEGDYDDDLALYASADRVRVSSTLTGNSEDDVTPNPSTEIENKIPNTRSSGETDYPLAKQQPQQELPQRKRSSKYGYLERHIDAVGEIHEDFLAEMRLAFDEQRDKLITEIEELETRRREADVLLESAKHILEARHREMRDLKASITKLLEEKAQLTRDCAAIREEFPVPILLQTLTDLAQTAASKKSRNNSGIGYVNRDEQNVSGNKENDHGARGNALTEAALSSVGSPAPAPLPPPRSLPIDEVLPDPEHTSPRSESSPPHRSPSRTSLTPTAKSNSSARPSPNGTISTSKSSKRSKDDEDIDPFADEFSWSDSDSDTGVDELACDRSTPTIMEEPRAPSSKFEQVFLTTVTDGFVGADREKVIQRRKNQYQAVVSPIFSQGKNSKKWTARFEAADQLLHNQQVSDSVIDELVTTAPKPKGDWPSLRKIKIPIGGYVRGGIPLPSLSVKRCCAQEFCPGCSDGGAPHMNKFTEEMRARLLFSMNTFWQRLRPQVPSILAFLRQYYDVETAILTAVTNGKQFHLFADGYGEPHTGRCNSMCSWALDNMFDQIGWITISFKFKSVSFSNFKLQ